MSISLKTLRTQTQEATASSAEVEGNFGNFSSRQATLARNILK